MLRFGGTICDDLGKGSERDQSLGDGWMDNE